MTEHFVTLKVMLKLWKTDLRRKFIEYLQENVDGYQEVVFLEEGNIKENKKENLRVIYDYLVNEIHLNPNVRYNIWTFIPCVICPKIPNSEALTEKILAEFRQVCTQGH